MTRAIPSRAARNQRPHQPGGADREEAANPFDYGEIERRLRDGSPASGARHVEVGATNAEIVVGIASAVAFVLFLFALPGLV